MREKTQHIDNQPLRDNSLIINQLGFNKTLTKDDQKNNRQLASV